MIFYYKYIVMFELATWCFVQTRREQVSPSSVFFLIKMTLGELWELTRGRPARALDNPSEPLSANTVWGKMEQEGS